MPVAWVCRGRSREEGSPRRRPGHVRGAGGHGATRSDMVTGQFDHLRRADPATGLQRVSAAGGAVTVLTRPDPSRGELGHAWPEAMPGGRAVLYTITAATGGLDAAQIAVLDLETGSPSCGARRESRSIRAERPPGLCGAAHTGRGAVRPRQLGASGGPGAGSAPARRQWSGSGPVQRVGGRDARLSRCTERRRSSRTHHGLGRSTGQGRTPRCATEVYASPRLSPDGKRVAIVHRRTTLCVGSRASDADAVDARSGNRFLPRLDARQPSICSSTRTVRGGAIFRQPADGARAQRP